ncbi:MAG: prenyltransferase/squalene oxidase repeat-containing protein [Verrucomicrobiota bacterium]|nr:prenyltransferase/squalene oxidase repeat-containing protein [Verrucomicrobiota bacterium]
MTTNPARLEAALQTAREALLAARNEQGHWTGELSSSALATATAVVALQIVQRETSAKHHHHIESGLEWLAANANEDGGWGDSIKSISNISTTTLCWAAFSTVSKAEEKHRSTVNAAKAWLTQVAGGTEPDLLAPAIIRRYGKDRTFSVPILTHCALAGKVGWADVLPLPFELAALPQKWFATLRLPMVSYALPALIAIGQCRHHHLPTWNPITRILRNASRKKTLGVLKNIQPSNGGFLEATPLTSFVTMSLASSGLADHPVVKKGIEFLLNSARDDGSWPIDTNLTTWVTTLSINALGEDVSRLLSEIERNSLRDWLIDQQYLKVHPYTNAPPGGWAWTNLPGGVPDADDTPGALLALKSLGKITDATRKTASHACTWLLDLQNRDGGIPTFCRGWSNLPFDRSSPDLTAHAIRAWIAWYDELPELQERFDNGLFQAARYLAKSEGAGMDGWAPLWFGNQHAPNEINWTYGTAKVLLAMNEPRQKILPGGGLRVTRAKNALLEMQRVDGAWSGYKDGKPSIEETALALEALAVVREKDPETQAKLEQSRKRGVLWLVEQVEQGTWLEPSPIGFYFAKLWYFEKLYPMITTVGALTRLVNAPKS